MYLPTYICTEDICSVLLAWEDLNKRDFTLCRRAKDAPVIHSLLLLLLHDGMLYRVYKPPYIHMYRRKQSMYIPTGMYVVRYIHTTSIMRIYR